MVRFPDTQDGIHHRAYRFALDVARAMDQIPWQRHSSQIICRQLTKAATSTGANLWEANAAQTRADFIAKCSIALKEVNEATYWLQLCRDLTLLPPDTATSLELQGREVLAILTTIVHRSKQT